MRFQVRQNMQPVLSAGKMLVTQDAFGFAFNWLKKSVFARIVEQNKKKLLNDGFVVSALRI